MTRFMRWRSRVAAVVFGLWQAVTGRQARAQDGAPSVSAPRPVSAPQRVLPGRPEDQTPTDMPAAAEMGGDGSPLPEGRPAGPFVPEEPVRGEPTAHRYAVLRTFGGQTFQSFPVEGAAPNAATDGRAARIAWETLLSNPVAHPGVLSFYDGDVLRAQVSQ